MNDTQKALKEKYCHIHPLLFQRSLEKAKTDGELFDILDGMPSVFPIIWDEKKREWTHTDDLLQSQNLTIVSG